MQVTPASLSDEPTEAIQSSRTAKQRRVCGYRQDVFMHALSHGVATAALGVLSGYSLCSHMGGLTLATGLLSGLAVLNCKIFQGSEMNDEDGCALALSHVAEKAVQLWHVAVLAYATYRYLF